MLGVEPRVELVVEDEKVELESPRWTGPPVNLDELAHVGWRRRLAPTWRGGHTNPQPTSVGAARAYLHRTGFGPVQSLFSPMHKNP